MIPAANITAWRRQAPWPDDNQVEQDLILSRLMVEIANDDLLGTELLFRGGTCLHKLHLPAPLRYSEDLDYVRRTKSGIKPYLRALADRAGALGLQESGTARSGPMVHATYDASPTSGAGRIRIKIEINIAETAALFDRVELPYEVRSPWWEGQARIGTFSIEEVLGTKLRALFQRSKGRDLFDLWYALKHASVDEDRVVQAFRHYAKGQEFTYPQLAQNLKAKLEDRGFREDVLQLLVDPPEAYDTVRAADVLMERLGPRLRNAPDLAEIQGGTWRA